MSLENDVWSQFIHRFQVVTFFGRRLVDRDDLPIPSPLFRFCHALPIVELVRHHPKEKTAELAPLF